MIIILYNYYNYSRIITSQGWLTKLHNGLDWNNITYQSNNLEVRYLY